jgi:hypothetical protein
MSKTLFKNDDLIVRDDAIGKLKSTDDLSRAAEKLKRDPRLDEVFLLFPENRKFLQGETARPASISIAGLVFSILCLALLVLLVWFALQFGILSAAEPAFGIIALAFVAIAGGGVALLAYYSLKSYFDERDFAQNGVVLVGSLSSIGGEWKRSTGKNRPPQYKVTVAYTVELPDGKVITETAWANRRDLEDFKARPKQGTPVAVQYSPNSKKVRLL